MGEQKKNIKYAEIIEEDDFGNVKESIVIDVCRKSGLVPKEAYEILAAGLRKRNIYAHPNSTAIADGPISAGHVSELIQFMLTLK